METTFNMNLNEFNASFIAKLKEMFVTGEVELTIKHKKEINDEILRKIKEVENGAILYQFSDDEFDKLCKDLLAGKKPDLTSIKKVKKNEKGRIVPL